MPDYDNNMRGVLFKNDKKQSDTHPDYKGNAEIEGVQYWVSAWIKTSSKGAKFMSMSFQAKEQQPAQQPQRPAAPKQAPEPHSYDPHTPVDDERIPF